MTCTPILTLGVHVPKGCNSSSVCLSVWYQIFSYIVHHNDKTTTGINLVWYVLDFFKFESDLPSDHHSLAISKLSFVEYT